MLVVFLRTFERQRPPTARKRLPYLKGASGEASLLVYREVLRSNYCDGSSDEGFLFFLRPKTVVGILELVEL
jgi:hypothetical protein